MATDQVVPKDSGESAKMVKAAEGSDLRHSDLPWLRSVQ
jgi:hypothetical protein